MLKWMKILLRRILLYPRCHSKRPPTLYNSVVQYLRMPRIYDNIEQHLLEGLRNAIQASYKADFCVGYFNLRGWGSIGDWVEQYEGEEGKQCRVLIGMQKVPKEIVRDLFNEGLGPEMDIRTVAVTRRKIAQEFREQLEIGIPTVVAEKHLRQLSKQLKSKKVRVKLFLGHQLHAKLYLVHRKDHQLPAYAFVGSSNLTLSGMTYQGELNVDVTDEDANKKLERWFLDRWEDNFSVDISEDLIAIIDESWASETLLPPYYIYLKMAYHLAREARAGLSEYKVTSEFDKELLEFQKKAVLVAARHLNHRGGVIIGDVVGLGKTITASALIKIFEDEHLLETLILCPKNLVEMWEDYVHRFQLRAKIFPITRVQNELHKLRRYRLVVIDESHNLRSREGKRYHAIRDYIQLNDSKVVLLSATPYNKSFLDLSNQLRLFIPDDRDLGISPERYIESIGGKGQFMVKHQTPVRSLAAFEKSEFADDWRELMRLYLVRRTRSFVKQYYTKQEESGGRKYLEFSDGTKSFFPDRLPKKAEYHFDPNDPNDQYARLYSDEVVEIINKLSLPRYGLGQEQYIEKNPIKPPSEAEKQVLANLGRAGERLKGFARTNLFKRLESSGYSFLLSLSRHILRNQIFLYAIENDLEFPIGKQEGNMVDDFLEDAANDDIESDSIAIITDPTEYQELAARIYQVFQQTKRQRFEWVGCRLFSKKLKQALIDDTAALLQIIEKGKDWKPSQDRQIGALYELCTQTHPDDKILIFTQYADTANYLYEQLKNSGVDRLEIVTGGTEDPTALAHRFSPVSNKKRQQVTPEKEIRVLVTTDVLSEGHNLQDAHIIVNYDLPWAIIRLIQRAGRVDRIGQQSGQIFCYSFLPEDGIEKIIRLRSRLRRRLEESDEVLGSPDEIFFDDQRVRQQLEALYSEQSGILDEEDDGEVDLSSYAYQIWKNALDQNPGLNKTIQELPNVVFSTKVNRTAVGREGVIVYTRTSDDNDILTWLNREGKVITQSQLTILKAAECPPNEPALPRADDHHDLTSRALEFIQEQHAVTGGALGRSTSVRARIYQRLKAYQERYMGTLFVTDSLSAAIDDIYGHPLQDGAKDIITRQLRSKADDDTLINLVVMLRESDRLCVIHDEGDGDQDAQIICSLGLV